MRVKERRPFGGGSLLELHGDLAILRPCHRHAPGGRLVTALHEHDLVRVPGLEMQVDGRAPENARLRLDDGPTGRARQMEDRRVRLGRPGTAARLARFYGGMPG